jgi:fructose-bisphosphate aldolase class II
VEAFVNRTGVDLLVPSLGTEHRGEPGMDIHYRRELAREITRRVGPRLALHGTSSLGDRVGGVGEDGICKVNFYTAMARAASAALREAWGTGPLPLERACGSFGHRTRRAAAQDVLTRLFEHIAG